MIDKSEAGVRRTPADFNTIIVTQTYEGYPQFVFKFKRGLSKDLREARQTFYGLEKPEQTAQLGAHRINILSNLLRNKPEGVEEIGYEDTGDLINDFKVFISAMTEEDEEFLTNIWIEWQGQAYPKELLSDASE